MPSTSSACFRRLAALFFLEPGFLGLLEVIFLDLANWLTTWALNLDDYPLTSWARNWRAPCANISVGLFGGTVQCELYQLRSQGLGAVPGQSGPTGIEEF